MIQYQICNTVLSGECYQITGFATNISSIHQPARVFLLGTANMSMSDRRRQEIESKRAKLAELRKARAERQRIDAEKRIPDVVIIASFVQMESLLILRLARHLPHPLLGEM